MSVRWPVALLLVGAALLEAPQGSCGTAAEGEGAEGDDASAAALVGLLQKSYDLVPREALVVNLQGGIPATGPSAKGAGVGAVPEVPLPLAFMHFPKAGSSFLNAMLNLPGVCQTQGVVHFNADCNPCGSHPSCTPEVFLHQACAGLYEVFNQYCHSDHLDAPGAYREHYLGHMMGMFRQPEQRILSSWYHCQRQEAVCPKDNVISTSLAHFVRVVQGSYVRMILGMSLYWFNTVWTTNTPVEEMLQAPAPTAEETALAVQRVREGFAFVGLTEQWDLSICLLHKMYGGRCNSWEFENTRPGTVDESTSSRYNTSILEGFTDQHDRQVYAEAERIFAEQSQRFDASLASCGACFEEAAGR